VYGKGSQSKHKSAFVLPAKRDIGNFDPADLMLTPKTNFHFSELDFHLRRHRTPVSILRRRLGEEKV
jgi:hypothetical protein